MAFMAFNIGHKTNATGIMLVLGAVKAFTYLFISFHQTTNWVLVEGRQIVADKIENYKQMLFKFSM